MPLVLAATPIGDPTDASPRLRAELATADVVAAEDTRRLRRLCAALEVEPAGRVVSHHEHNERERAEDLLEAMRGGARVLVVTDARRKEVYWARYRDGARVEGPGVCRAAELPDALRALPTVGRGPLLYPDALADPLTAPGRPLLDVDAAALARVAVDGIRAGSPMPTTPLYLRRPDAQEPGAPKSATSPTPVRRSDVLEPSKGTP